ncbi:MAG: hypothetical protein ACRDUX_06460 [Mycobacterium sp.]
MSHLPEDELVGLSPASVIVDENDVLGGEGVARAINTLGKAFAQ